MKKVLFVITLILFGIGLKAQTKNHKVSITAGFGSQHYKGDVGNNFFDYKGYTYGVAAMGINYYLDRYWDIAIGGTMGDYGLCQTNEVANKEVSAIYLCPGCKGRKGLGNISSRMTSGLMLFKFKIANGEMFKENAKIAPYIYLGVGLNHIVDRMKMNCVCAGDYFSINTGAGFKYNLTEKLNIGYNIAFGIFQSDKVDFIDKGGHDKYLQNTLFLGINL